MKQKILFISMLFVSTLCFAELNIPRKIYGSFPRANSAKLYEIQIGAFLDINNGEKYILILEGNGYIPVYEQYLDFTRVKITGIPAREVRSHLIKMKQMGFDEVIIREDTAEYMVMEEPEEEIIEEIIEEEITEETPKSIAFIGDIFCRSWVIEKSDKSEYSAYRVLFSDDGTYLITKSNGESLAARWRWHDKLKVFEYSHNNWQSYGRAQIIKLDETSLQFIDSGFNILGNGYSTLGKDTSYELKPLVNPNTPE